MSGVDPGSWPQGGVHRVPGALRPIAAELADRGWHVAVVPPAATDQELWDGLADALGLPAWFGRNLDALEEALGGLGPRTALVLGGWSAYARARPERWGRLLELLEAWAAEPGTGRLVVLTDQEFRGATSPAGHEGGSEP